TGKRGEANDLEVAGRELVAALGHRRILLVIDDVWRAADAEPFLSGGPNTARLITTRNNSVLPEDAHPIEVDAMAAPDADRLLARGFEDKDVAENKQALDTLRGKLKGWAQGLAIVNSYLRRRVGPLD